MSGSTSARALGDWHAPALGGPGSEVVWSGLSRRGRPVRVAIEVGRHPGAQPYYVITIGRGHARYTPFENVARFLAGRFLDEVTDPARLPVGRPVGVERVRLAGPAGATSPRSVIETPGQGGDSGSLDSAVADPHEQRRFAMGFYDGRTGARAGGRPRVHPSPEAAQAAASRAYRARRRAYRARWALAPGIRVE